MKKLLLLLIIICIIFILLNRFFCTFIEKYTIIDKIIGSKNIESDQYNIKIIIHERPEYLPLMLYTKSLYYICKNKNLNVELINNIDEINENYKDIILILFFFDCKPIVFDIIRQNNIKTFIINTEYYKHFNFEDKIKIMNDEKLDITILEYSNTNYKSINTEYPNVKIIYSPLLFNPYLIEYYNDNLEIKLDCKDKDIDIFFFGNLNDRRKNIIDQLKIKYNVICSDNYTTNEKLVNFIERSKIVLNINHHDYHCVFDYYRNAFLIANKVFLIYELPRDIDFNIESNLIDIKENLITPEYNKIIETVEYYIDNYNCDLVKKQIEKQLIWFKKLTLEDNLNKYLIESKNI
jgi:hypothetical protein